MIQGVLSRFRTLSALAVLVLFLLAVHILYSTGSSPLWRVPGSASRVTDKPGTKPISPPPVPGSLNEPSNQAPATGNVETAIPDEIEPAKALPCLQLSGGENVVVIMRTGATEIQDKLPMHFETTFKCLPDTLIFSDYAEDFLDHQVHDVLAPMDQSLKEDNPDFELYTRLKNHGRESLHDYELSGTISTEGNGKSGKLDNPGWKLDKWKFLPMMNETLQLRPDKQWYVFMESDSYPVWSNILQWLKRLDPSQPHYYGSEVQIGPDVFAHGGSVFVMSRSAIEKGAQYYAENRQWWDTFTDGHWAGDCVLGKELREAKVPLEWGWPIFQGGNPDKMDFTEKKGEEKRLWCSSALSYHHFSPSELPKMFEFEQTWIQSRLDKASNLEKRWPFRKDYSNVLEHRDVFKHFVWPRIRTQPGQSWDNLSPNLLNETEGVTASDCRRHCEDITGCLQYSVCEKGCSISTREVMLGEKAEGINSGWMLDRIEDWISDMDKCGRYEGWTIT